LGAISNRSVITHRTKTKCDCFKVYKTETYRKKCRLQKYDLEPAAEAHS